MTTSAGGCVNTFQSTESNVCEVCISSINVTQPFVCVCVCVCMCVCVCVKLKYGSVCMSTVNFCQLHTALLFGCVSY